MDIRNYGIPALNIPGLVAARVTAVHRERFEVITEFGLTHARMKRGLHLTADEMPTVGDYIAISYNPDGDSVAQKVLERRTLFARQEAWTGARQLVAANMDIVCIVTSINREFNVSRLERYLALARESGAKPVFLLTKLDLAEPAEVQAAEEAVKALAPDCPVLPLSTVTGEGMQALWALLAPGVTAVLLGSSGVGKSSLTNVLTGGSRMKTGEIREDDDRGRHTTVHRQMLETQSGALLIDTPGMRQLAMWDAVDGVADVFAEVSAVSERCRFRDCTHTHEPGCAVRAAVENGILDPRRVENYRKMRAEADRTAVMAQKRAKMKEISKFSRARKKQK